MLIDLKVRPEVPPLAGFTHVRMTKFSAMLRFINVFFRHAGLEELAPYLIRGHPDVVPTPYPVRGKLQSGTISKTGSRFSPGTLDSCFRRNDVLCCD